MARQVSRIFNRKTSLANPDKEYIIRKATEASNKGRDLINYQPYTEGEK